VGDERKTIVVIPAYNEAEAVERTIKDFLDQDYVDEVIVVDNGSTDGTGEIARRTGVVVVDEPKKGYGHALMRGMREALARGADLVMLAEADASFLARDGHKLLAYIDEVDMVFGSRATLELIDKNAKWDRFLHYGNLFIAKFLQVCWWGKIRLTDVGCTLRLLTRNSVQTLLNSLSEGGSAFLVDLVTEALIGRLRCVEIPVHYKERIGSSKITSNRLKSIRVGLRMLWIVLKKRFRRRRAAK